MMVSDGEGMCVGESGVIVVLGEMKMLRLMELEVRFVEKDFIMELSVIDDVCVYVFVGGVLSMVIELLSENY